MQKRMRPSCTIFLTGILLGSAILPAYAAKADKKSTPAQLRSDYIARIQEQAPAPPTRTVGSLWSPEAVLTDISTDYKARRLNDTLVILVSVKTTAAQNADLNSQRTFQTSSGITGLAADIKTKSLSSLFNAN